MAVNYILCLVVFINLATALFIILRDYRNNISKFFGIAVFISGLWSASLLLFRIGGSIEFTVLMFKLTYILGLTLALSLYYYSFIFPYKSEKSSLIEQPLVLISFAIIQYVLLTGDRFVTSLDLHIGWTNATTDPVLHIIYSLFLSFLFIRVIINFIYKYKKSTSINRITVRSSLIGIALAMIAGFTFDILLPYFGNYYLNWIGPLSTLIMIALLFRLLLTTNKV